MKKIYYIFILIYLSPHIYAYAIQQRLHEIDDQIAVLTNIQFLKNLDQAIADITDSIKERQKNLKNDLKIKERNRILKIALQFNNKKQIERLRKEIRNLAQRYLKGIEIAKGRIADLQKQKVDELNKIPGLQDLLKEKNNLMKQL